jgi:DNA-binding protein YbaB
MQKRLMWLTHCKQMQQMQEQVAQLEKEVAAPFRQMQYPQMQ